MNLKSVCKILVKEYFKRVLKVTVIMMDSEICDGGHRSQDRTCYCVSLCLVRRALTYLIIFISIYFEIMIYYISSYRPLYTCVKLTAEGPQAYLRNPERENVCLSESPPCHELSLSESPNDLGEGVVQDSL